MSVITSFQNHTRDCTGPIRERRTIDKKKSSILRNFGGVVRCWVFAYGFSGLGALGVYMGVEQNVMHMAWIEPDTIW